MGRMHIGMVGEGFWNGGGKGLGCRRVVTHLCPWTTSSFVFWRQSLQGPREVLVLLNEGRRMGPTMITNLVW